MIESIAHRGNSVAARENTLPAFRAAVDAVCDFVELDIRVTADGECVVLHDPTLARLWGVPRRIDELTWAEVQAAGLGELRIPRLAEVLELCAPTPTGVLIDVGTPAEAQAALAVVRAQDTAPRIQWCGETDALRAVRDADPDACLRVSTLGLSEAEFAALRPAYLNAEWSDLTPDSVAAAHRAGCRVACWTPDAAEDIRACIALGVDAITSNQLRRLNALLDADDALHTTPDPDAAAAAQAAGVDLERCWRVAQQIAEAVVTYTRDAPVAERADKASAADFVTNVDLGVERLVRAMLAAAFPDHGVVGEEFGGQPEPGRPTWYVDPVDGTTNLGNRIPWTSLSLGLALDDQPLLGVVAQPWSGDVAAASVAHAPTLNGVPLPAPEAATLAGAAVALELNAQSPWPGMGSFIDALAERDCTARVMGSGTLTVSMPGLGRGAAGTVDAFNPIDHLAGVVIARAAGCRVLHPGGEAPSFPHRGEPLLVCAPGVTDELAAAWREALRAG